VNVEEREQNACINIDKKPVKRRGPNH